MYRTTHNSFYLFVVELRHQAEAEYYRHYLIEISFVTHNIDNKLIVGNAYTIRSTVFGEFSAEVVVRLARHSTCVVHKGGCVLEFLVGMCPYLILKSKREDIVLGVFDIEKFTAIEEVFRLDIGEVGKFRRRSLYGILNEIFVILRIFFVGHFEFFNLCLIEKLYFRISLRERNCKIIA